MTAQRQEEPWLREAGKFSRMLLLAAILFGIADLVLTERHRIASNPNGAPVTPAHVDGAQPDDPILEGSINKEGLQVIARRLATAFLAASIFIYPATAFANRISKRPPKKIKRVRASAGDVPPQELSGDQK